MKKLIAVLFAFVLTISCAAFAETGNYLFMQGEDGIYVCGYDGLDTVLRLPETFKNEPVVGVAEGAFKANRNIIEVYIPDSYRVIGIEAFADCTSLRDVYLGSGIRLIDERAFRGCGDLLSVAIVQNDFYEDPTAFDAPEGEVPYNGADIDYFRENNTGEPHDWLYIAACDMMSRGDFVAARDVFLSLYGYELSSDYYFYCCGRIYEQQGDIDAALAVYALIPDLNDCAERIAYYGGQPAVPTFFTGEYYPAYYEMYFGENGAYAYWLDTDPEDASAAVIGGADGPTSIIVTDEADDDESTITGAAIGNLLDSSQTGGAAVSEQPAEAPAETPAEAPEAPAEEPVEEPAAALAEEPAETAEEPAETAEEPAEAVEETPVNTGLISYHDFSGKMPYSFDDHSASEGYFAIYYFIEDDEDVEEIYAYAKIFEENGWGTMSETDFDGWEYIYVVNEATDAYFMIGYSLPDGMLVFMYETGLPYGFEPANGL